MAGGMWLLPRDEEQRHLGNQAERIAAERTDELHRAIVKPRGGGFVVQRAFAQHPLYPVRDPRLPEALPEEA